MPELFCLIFSTSG